MCPRAGALRRGLIDLKARQRPVVPWGAWKVLQNASRRAVGELQPPVKIGALKSASSPSECRGIKASE